MIDNVSFSNQNELYIYAKNSPSNIYSDNNLNERRKKFETESLNDLLGWFLEAGLNIKKIMEQIPEFSYFDLMPEKVKVSDNFETHLEKINKKLFSVIDPRAFGEYYTSVELSNRMLSEIDLPDKFGKVIDPSIGSGFLMNQYMKKQKVLIKRESQVTNVTKNIYGYDIFPYAVITSKLLIGYFLFSIFEDYTSFALPNIKLENPLMYFSDKKNNDKFDFIIGNPPYFRIDPKKSNFSYRGKTTYGHSYAHSLFLEWTIDHLSEAGMMSLILPESILSGFYYQKSREYLLKNISDVHILLGKTHMQSFDVQQEIMMVSGKKEYMNQGNIIIHNVDSKEKFLFSKKELSNSKSVVPTITNKVEFQKIMEVSKLFSSLDIQKIHVGTGNFVWNQNKNLLGDKLKSSKDAVPLITAKNIVEGNVTISGSDFISNPKSKFIKNHEMIIYRRMAPIDYERRFMGAIINDNTVSSWILENHINYIDGLNTSELEKLFEILNSEAFNSIINVFSHTNQLSSNDLYTILEILSHINYGGDHFEQIELL